MGETRVAVTGGSGKAGRAVMSELSERGLEAVEIDVNASPDPDSASLVVDLTDLGQTLEVLSGFNQVVHLAAVPAPNILTDGETFRINTISTYNVMSAAATLGMGKVVWASSETLIGIPLDREPPRFAPIDESHPVTPESHYALSKLVGEQVAEQVSRWSGIPIVSLRISNIMEEHDYSRFPQFWEDPSVRAWNLWGYVDARDVAQAVAQAVVTKTDGCEAYLVAASDTCMTTTSSELMASFYPDVPLTREPVGHETLLSIDKARAHLGYEPAHAWRSYVG